MRMFELLPRPLGSIFRKLTHLTCNSRFCVLLQFDGTAHFGHRQDIGVDFALAARFTQNNQRKIARCDTSTLHPAIAELRKVRRGDFAPCDILMLHLATSRYRTLPLSRVAPCDSKTPLLPLKSHPLAAMRCPLYKERAREASAAAKASANKSLSRPSTSPTSPTYWRRCERPARRENCSALCLPIFPEQVVERHFGLDVIGIFIPLGAIRTDKSQEDGSREAGVFHIRNAPV